MSLSALGWYFAHYSNTFQNTATPVKLRGWQEASHVAGVHARLCLPRDWQPGMSANSVKAQQRQGCMTYLILSEIQLHFGGLAGAVAIGQGACAPGTAATSLLIAV